MNHYLYLNRFMTSFADYGLMFLIPLYVFQSTDSVQLAGLAFTLEYLVKVFFSPIAGLFIDRYPLIKMLNWVNAMRAIVGLIVALSLWVLLSISDQVDALFLFSLVLVLSVFNGLGFSVNFMAQETLLTELIPSKVFAKAQAKIQSLEQMALVSAPIVFSMALNLMAFYQVLVFICLIFLLASLSLILGTKGISTREPSDVNLTLKARLKANLDVGRTYLVESKPLQRIVLSTFLLNLIYGTLLAIGAPAVIGYFDKDATSFASLQTAGALSSIFVLILIVRISDKVTPTQLGITAFIFVSMGGMISGFANQFELFVLGAMLVLGFDGMFNVYIRTRRMEIIPRKDYGKAMGLLMVVNNTSKPLSGLIVFSLGHWFSVLEILIIATLLASLLTFVLRLFYTGDETESVIKT